MSVMVDEARQEAAADGSECRRWTAEQLAAIEQAVPKGAAAGDRYQPAQLAMLDSER